MDTFYTPYPLRIHNTPMATSVLARSLPLKIRPQEIALSARASREALTIPSNSLCIASGDSALRRYVSPVFALSRSPFSISHRGLRVPGHKRLVSLPHDDADLPFRHPEEDDHESQRRDELEPNL